MLTREPSDRELEGWIAATVRGPQRGVDDVSSPRRHRAAGARPAARCSTRFQRGGRLLAFGRGAYATDAQHVSVEFVHPVIVGKRALPALDFSWRSLRGSTPCSSPTTS